MSKVARKKAEFLDELKSNYEQRIEEVDSFSKHLSINAAGYRSEFLTSVLDVVQHYVDLQKKTWSKYPKWYDDTLMTRQSELITNIWIQAFRNMDIFYGEYMEYARKNLRAYNRVTMQTMETAERFYDMFQNVPMIQRDTFIELIKEAKEYNDKLVKNNFQNKVMNTHKAKAKKTSLAKEIS